MSRRLSQTTSPAPPPPLQSKPKAPLNGSCILPGYNAPVPEQNRPVRNKMKSNIFGVDENTKFEASRSNIGSGGDVDIKFPCKEDQCLGKPYFDAKAAERLLLHNVSLANSDNLQNSLSILIEEGKIIEIRETAIEVPEVTQKIDCTGQYCLPGLVDFNTHLLWQSHDPTFGILKDISQHAVKTGTTTIAETLICPANVCPYEMVARFKQAMQAVENLFWCDVVIRLGLSHLDETTINDKLPRIVTELGVSSFMFFISVNESDKQVDGATPELLEKALAKCHELGAIALCRWDGHPLTTAVTARSKSEQAMIQLATCQAVVKIVANTDCPTVMLGLDSAPAIQYLSKVANQLPKVPIRYTFSVEPFVNEEQAVYNSLVPELAKTHFLGVTSDQTALLGPSGYTLSQRATKLWKSLIVDGLADLPNFVNVASTEAAKFLGLYPAKGKIAVGADADLVLWAQETLQNPGAEEVSQEVMPSLVIMAGEVVARDGQVVGASPGGIIYSAKIMPAIPYEQLRSIKQFKSRWPSVKPELSLNVNEVTTWLARQGLSEDKTAKNDKTQLDGAGGRRNTARNLFESSFTLGGNEDNGPVRTSIRTHHPPGGGSDTRIW